MDGKSAGVDAARLPVASPNSPATSRSHTIVVKYVTKSRRVLYRQMLNRVRNQRQPERSQTAFPVLFACTCQAVALRVMIVRPWQFPVTGDQNADRLTNFVQPSPVGSR